MPDALDGLEVSAVKCGTPHVWHIAEGMGERTLCGLKVPDDDGEGRHAPRVATKLRYVRHGLCHWCADTVRARAGLGTPREVRP